jgi:hypothetical protein
MGHSIVECVLLTGTRSAEGIMASGHVNRAQRPNTWLLRPNPAGVKKVLANPEPSTHGPFETCRRALEMSGYRSRPQAAPTGVEPTLLTQSDIRSHRNWPFV